MDSSLSLAQVNAFMLRNFFQGVFKQRPDRARNGAQVSVQMRIVCVFVQTLLAVFLKAGEL